MFLNPFPVFLNPFPLSGTLVENMISFHPAVVLLYTSHYTIIQHSNSPASVRSYKRLSAKQGPEKVLNTCMLSQLAALALGINNFLLPFVLFIRYTRNPLYLETVHNSIE